MIISRSPILATSLIFALLLFSALSKVGNIIVYGFFLVVPLWYLLTGIRVWDFPKKLMPLAVCLLFFVIYSSFFSANLLTHLIYSCLYCSCLLTTLFAYRFPEQAVLLMVYLAIALSGLVWTAILVGQDVVRFFINAGFDTNYSGYILVAGIFALSRFTVYRASVSRLLILMMLIAGLLLVSRSFILLMVCLCFLTVWEKARYGKFFLGILVLSVAYFLINLLAENQALFLALTAAVTGEVELGGLVEDRRRIELFATGIRAVMEFFPFGTGMGPENYKAAVLDAGLVTSSTLRLGYPHNYFISGIAQAGIAGVIFIAYLVKIGISARKDFPVIGALLIGLAFNEYIGITVLWIYFGLYFNEHFG